MGIKNGRSDQITKTCKTCGQKFHPLYGSPNSLYCSIKCYFANRWGQDHKESITCQFCSKVFKDFIDNKRKFCSQDCYWKSGTPKLGKRKRLTKICEWCGKEFSRPICNFHSKHFFCSHSCSAKWWHMFGLHAEKHPRWMGGFYPHSRGEWQQSRKGALQKAKFGCEMCGKNNCRLEVHHIEPLRHSRSYKKSNHSKKLIVLCVPCHRKAEKITKTIYPQLSLRLIANKID